MQSNLACKIFVGTDVDDLFNNWVLANPKATIQQVSVTYIDKGALDGNFWMRVMYEVPSNIIAFPGGATGGQV